MVHVPLLQIPEVQLPPTTQFWLGRHSPHPAACPQSTSSSRPFFTPSEHVQLWHVALLLRSLRVVPAPAQTPSEQLVEAVHCCPTIHFGQYASPQSTSLSNLFFTPSVQVGALQVPPVHTPDWQSVAVLHAWPVPQGQPPPQSTDVSSPFFTPSSHRGTAHFPAVHTPDSQSATVLQEKPLLHCIQSPPQLPQLWPPVQSVIASVSRVAASRSKLEHRRSRHVPPWHSPLVQSLPELQTWPTAQRLAAPQSVPPQSTPTSSPFVTPSSQAASEQVPPVHFPVAQSLSIRHVSLVLVHLLQRPPQSIEVSLPLNCPSAHVASRHMLLAHIPLAQSAFTLHCIPGAHARLRLPVAHVPPQSV